MDASNTLLVARNAAADESEDVVGDRGRQGAVLGERTKRDESCAARPKYAETIRLSCKQNEINTSPPAHCFTPRSRPRQRLALPQPISGGRISLLDG